ncbi:hypothetical protein GSU69_19730 (plasmid) [Rathayibacter festucae]|uniref:CopG family transcriptional regulator n=1 Tax=Rathayibacter festucae TaxID=110937 RepID=A0ABX6H5M4_9MICO|nr:hypothetical protein [Rathayibacter festucae]QHC65086.1 hypothetical protein GSU69_19730 [Rathayibacter festucae]
MPDQPKTPLHSVRVPTDLWQAAKTRTADRGTNISAIIVTALTRYVTQQPSTRNSGTLMELIGTNVDSSGYYKMYLDGQAMVTYTGSDEDSVEELVRQNLVPAPDFTAPADEWYLYGANGHVCDVHYEGDHARIDGATYELIAE